MDEFGEIFVGFADVEVFGSGFVGDAIGEDEFAMVVFWFFGEGKGFFDFYDVEFAHQVGLIKNMVDVFRVF